MMKVPGSVLNWTMSPPAWSAGGSAASTSSATST
jgi:hypothetical protein